MPTHVVHARSPRGPARLPHVRIDADAIAAVLEDAAHYPGGYARGVATPATEGEVAALVRLGVPLLPIGAQSSLTGGATPNGELVVSSAGLRTCAVNGRQSVTVGAGVVLDDLQSALAPHDLWYPPVPTWTGATCGGVVATNAAGPATFKYGSTRDWVEALTVVLADGSAIDLERGAAVAGADGVFDVVSAGTVRRVPVPAVAMPPVPKRSAGYAGGAAMDLVDLFIGSEGTLGIITEVRLRVTSRPAARCRALVPVEHEDSAPALVAALRDVSFDTRRSGAASGLDVAAIEHMDRRCLALLREEGVLAREHVLLPPGTAVLLLVEIEIAGARTDAELWREVETALDPGGPDGPLRTFCGILATHHLLENTELALPAQDGRMQSFVRLREAVPQTVNARVATAKQRDTRISKTAADVVVPFPRIGDLTRACRDAFDELRLDGAIWGHFSDGNLHPNVIPRTFADVERGRDAIRRIGRATIAFGGCPLAEHGVGRNPLKKTLMAELHGAAGVESMRAVKRALDPQGLLAPGVLIDL